MTFYNPPEDEADSVVELWRMEFEAIVGTSALRD